MNTTASTTRDSVVTAEARAYIDGVAGAGITAQRNVEAWQSISIRPHVMKDVRSVDTRVPLLGRTLPTPIIAAPWAGHGYAHPDGEWVSARAAAATRVTFALSSWSTKSVESVAALSGPFIQQIYLPDRRELLRGFLGRVVDAGAFALALTVDNPTTPHQHAFRTGLSRVTSSDSENFPEISDRRLLAGSANITADDIKWLSEITGLPVMVKGVLRSDDALRALDGGAAGIIVSNHAGRQLDGVVATAHVLPAITKAVGGSAPVLVDGGIRTGADVLKALALGASAVMIGRPIARALVDGGYDLVRDTLAAHVDDFAFTLAMAGVPNAVDIGPDLISRHQL